MPAEQQDKETAVLPISTGSGQSQGKREAFEVAEEARKAEYQNPSFASQMFMGNFAIDLLYPFPIQREEDRRIGDNVIDSFEMFLRENLDPDEVEKTRTIPKPVIDEMAKRGLFAIKIPKEYGGLGFSHTNYNRLVMRVASYCGSTGVLLSAHQSIGVPQPLQLYGTEEQKKKFLPRFREGSISAFALTEPDVGSDPAQMKTTAVRSADGSHYVLNGDKLWCTNGTIADIIVVMAQTEPKIVKGKERKQISAFILETNTPGVEVVHRCEFMGLGGIYNGLLKFTDVKIPAENLLWEEGRGLALALGTINVGRLTLPSACTGGAKGCLAIARRWGLERVQWGMPIGLHEAGREKIAYIAATTFAMEAVSLLTCAWADRKDVDIRIEAAMAKMFCTEALWKIVDMTMQLRGGRGYETARSLKARGELPYPVERIMRDCRINMILEGTTEIMKLFLAREALEPHLKVASGLLNPKATFGSKFKSFFHVLGFYSLWYPKQWLYQTRSYKEFGAFESQFSYIEKTAHRLSRTLFNAMITYREKLEQKQLFLGRLMEIGTDLFAMSAACSFAISKKVIIGNETPIELAQYFCAIAKRRIENQFIALHENDDAHGDALAKRVLDKHMKWLEQGIIWTGPQD